MSDGVGLVNSEWPSDPYPSVRLPRGDARECIRPSHRKILAPAAAPLTCILCAGISVRAKAGRNAVEKSAECPVRVKIDRGTNSFH